ncbi:hypothetical protein HN51_058419 [Arachis hypogaea]
MLDVQTTRMEAFIVYIKVMLPTLCKPEETPQMIPIARVQVQDEPIDKKSTQPPLSSGRVGTIAVVLVNNSDVGASGQTFIHQLTSSQKGKGIVDDLITNISLDVVALNSPRSEDNLVLLNHLSSTSAICTGATLIQQALTGYVGFRKCGTSLNTIH